MVVIEQLARWRLAPIRREEPGSLEELCTIVRAAHRDRQSLLPVGDGEALGASGRPLAADWLLEMRRLTGIVALVPGDLTAVVRAGTPLAELNTALAAERLVLPGAGSGAGTLGGLLASGYTGADASVLDGALSERVLGLTAVDGLGVAAKSGGRVVKNVAGYDLHRAHAGACGALGIVGEITVRLEPAPEAHAAVQLAAPRLAAVEAAWRDLRARGPELSGVRVRPVAGADGLVELTTHLAGDREAVADSEREVVALVGPHGSVSSLAGEEASTSERVGDAAWSVRLLAGPGRVFAAVERALALAAGAGASVGWEALPERGAVRLDLVRGDARTLWHAVAAESRRGLWSYRVEADADPFEDTPPAWSADPAALRLLARWKAAVDPAGILRPGSYSRERLERAAEYFEAPEPVAEVLS